MPLVVFQAYCGGSGCHDGANWGVIETEKLRVLTVPSDSNRAETEKLLGNQPLPRLKMMSVLHEPLQRANPTLKEQKPMYGLIGKIKTKPGQRDSLASILLRG